MGLKRDRCRISGGTVLLHSIHQSPHSERIKILMLILVVDARLLTEWQTLYCKPVNTHHHEPNYHCLMFKAKSA